MDVVLDPQETVRIDLEIVDSLVYIVLIKIDSSRGAIRVNFYLVKNVIIDLK